ncbi:AbrB/MazE/SpoVT family DNA-binding domain-containing protein [Bacillus sp. FJAT-42376]|uniref:AbrB/MazE/SpoVT family DNA-binding domain-containing protein n=1 Tax=Bacillus sp. FJAT-42376 TaxID=2014076 RepID=UPI000F4FF624|nr:AbrB/MazE/SpoVT family DNA-binding domain-containing protein [Bacillus sp. FJAT-42376]AZB42463.1 AbrB/MazE/SpoVT family DNA-binding domain-containing protein [Bacillus sp. FJAT-42376]
MKSTGIVRKVDELGRVVLPIELRRALHIEDKDPIEIFLDDEKIVLQKYTSQDSCLVTGEISAENQSFADGKIILSPEGAQKLVEELQERMQIHV